MTPYITKDDNSKYTIAFEIGYKERITFENLDKVDVINFLRYYDDMHHYDDDNERPVKMMVEVANGGIEECI